MSVLANGTEYEVFYEMHCSRCVHDQRYWITGWGEDSCDILRRVSLGEDTPELTKKNLIDIPECVEFRPFPKSEEGCDHQDMVYGEAGYGCPDCGFLWCY